MKLADAIRQGIRRVRDPKWANPNDYILLDLVEMNGRFRAGPWLHLYSPLQPVIGQPTPQDIPLWNAYDRDEDDCCEPYTGEINPADKGPK